ncbi:MAG: class I SAM-dependent methyltransferase [Nocardia sp.]|nr:class I SAM-dependent methyltransferase [Nocardia sp.]
MEAGRPSRTALATAWARAFHQLADEPRIFVDPLAVPLLGEKTVGDNRFYRDMDPAHVRRLRLFLAARARFAEDTVTGEIAAGTRQVVILGAGLDTSAYRNTDGRVRFFEVDHPATQRWKRHRLSEAAIAIPPSVTFVPMDFTRQSLATELAAAGLDRGAPTVFIWLGVSVYLEPEAVTETLRYLGAGDSVVVFDYSNPPPARSEPDGLDRAQAHRDRASRVAAAGEPWLSYFTADQMRAELESAGFSDIHDQPASNVVRGYIGAPPADPSISGAHLVRARTLGASR